MCFNIALKPLILCIGDVNEYGGGGGFMHDKGAYFEYNNETNTHTKTVQIIFHIFE